MHPFLFATDEGPPDIIIAESQITDLNRHRAKKCYFLLRSETSKSIACLVVIIIFKVKQIYI